MIRFSWNRWGPEPFLLGAVCVAAFLTRLIPLSVSPLPFNNDSVTEFGMASEILDSGKLDFGPESIWYGTHGASTPVFNVLIAFMSSCLGVEPFACAQLLIAVVSTVTVAAVYKLGRSFSGDMRGGVTAALMAVMMGTFVFTTGSVWKASLGICLMVLTIFVFVNRDRLEFRMTAFVLLVLIPFTHHVVAAVTLLMFAYVLVWIWHRRLRSSGLWRRIILDTVTIVFPAAMAGFYYMHVSLDRLTIFSSPTVILLAVAGFMVFVFFEILVLSLRRHVKWSFAPYIALGLVAIVTADYLGLVFPYSSSASPAILILVCSIALLVSLAWYGAETVVEDRRSPYRTIVVVLLLAPLTLAGLGVIGGATLFSHQVIYRTFDFFDPFIFVAGGMGLVYLYKRRKKLYVPAGVAVIIALSLSFPFAYESEHLLGIRHDTQQYELDAIHWLGANGDEVILVSDERLSYITRNTIGVPTNPGLPQQFATAAPFLHYQWFYLIEESWTTRGVNNYPNGRFVMSESAYLEVLRASDVFYVGGPKGDALVMFLSSDMGWRTLQNASYFPAN